MGELMTAQNASKSTNIIQEAYNVVEDNKNLRDNYELSQNKLSHDQLANREKKKNILEENLAKRRARVAAMGMSGDGSALAEQQREAYEGYKDIAEDDYNYYHQYKTNRVNTKYKIRSNAVNGIFNATQSLLK